MIVSRGKSLLFVKFIFSWIVISLLKYWLLLVVFHVVVLVALHLAAQYELHV